MQCEALEKTEFMYGRVRCWVEGHTAADENDATAAQNCDEVVCTRNGDNC